MTSLRPQIMHGIRS